MKSSMKSATTKGTNPDWKGFSSNPAPKYACTVNNFQNKHLSWLQMYKLWTKFLTNDNLNSIPMNQFQIVNKAAA